MNVTEGLEVIRERLIENNTTAPTIAHVDDIQH